MDTSDERIWFEHLTTQQCWGLLAAQPVGRIGVLVDSAPEVYPVNHVVDGATIVFRTDPGNKLRGIDRSPSVCYEVDGIDAGDRTGWSVLVKGRAVELGDADVGDALRTSLRYWGLGDKNHWIRIVPREVTGRRIHRSAVPPCRP
jgi:nitroimidazol reductase NimA-like FMN-containing flavoprotein (pyridoxamine 5'-phosphate oxidase superfamily)